MYRFRVATRFFPKTNAVLFAKGTSNFDKLATAPSWEHLKKHQERYDYNCIQSSSEVIPLYVGRIEVQKAQQSVLSEASEKASRAR